MGYQNNYRVVRNPQDVVRNKKYVTSYITKTPIEERNKFSDDVAILVIGHLDYAEILSQYYKDLKNVFFVIDNTEYEKNVKLLELHNIKYWVCDIPEEFGYGNVNLQASSSEFGLRNLKELGFNNVVRMRSDQIILQIHKFINNFKFDKPGYFSYVEIEREHPRVLDGGYLMDYCITGEIDSLIEMFKYRELTKDNTLCAESKLFKTYLKSKKLEVKYNYDYVKKLVYFMLPVLIEHNINFLMLKQDYNDWTYTLPKYKTYKFENNNMNIEIISNNRLAYDSPDHIEPHGTKNDNYTNLDLIKELESEFGHGGIKLLDVGCSGGQFVIDVYNNGNIAVGIEGSDYSLNNKRANWKDYSNKLLFTCDATKPYEILNNGERLYFNVITAWEVIEHIKYEDLPLFFQYIEDNLEPGGIFIGSVSTHEDVKNGVRLHQSVFTKEEWDSSVWEHALKNTSLKVNIYPYKNHVRGGSMSFHVLLKR